LRHADDDRMIEPLATGERTIRLDDDPLGFGKVPPSRFAGGTA